MFHMCSILPEKHLTPTLSVRLCLCSSRHRLSSLLRARMALLCSFRRWSFSWMSCVCFFCSERICFWEVRCSSSCPSTQAEGKGERESEKNEDQAQHSCQSHYIVYYLHNLSLNSSSVTLKWCLTTAQLFSTIRTIFRTSISFV